MPVPGSLGAKKDAQPPPGTGICKAPARALLRYHQRQLPGPGTDPPRALLAELENPRRVCRTRRAPT